MNTGVGMIGMDVAVFMLVSMAAMVQIYHIPTRYRQDPYFAIGSICRLIGWTLLTTRFAYVLATTGDLLIPVPSAIAVGFLACGDLSVVAFKGRTLKL